MSFIKKIPCLFFSTAFLFIFLRGLVAAGDPAREKEMENAFLITQNTQKTAAQTAQQRAIPPKPQNYSEDMQKYYDIKKELDESGSALPREEYIDEPGKGRFFIGGGYDFNYMRYKEYSGPNTLDEDAGHQDGFYVNAGFKGGRPLAWLMDSRPYVEGYFRRYEDEITYDGASGAGPISFKERSAIKRYGLKLGGTHNFSEKLNNIFYFDVGQQVWYRGENEVIGGVLTYAERYRWVYLGLGGGFNYRLLPKFSCGAEIEVMGAIDSKMRADLYEGGTFILKDVYGFEVKVPLKYEIFKNLTFDATGYFTWWSISRSDPVTISGTAYYEPDSHTYVAGLLTGLTYAF